MPTLLKCLLFVLVFSTSLMSQQGANSRVITLDTFEFNQVGMKPQGWEVINVRPPDNPLYTPSRLSLRPSEFVVSDKLNRSGNRSLFIYWPGKGPTSGHWRGSGPNCYVDLKPEKTWKVSWKQILFEEPGVLVTECVDSEGWRTAVGEVGISYSILYNENRFVHRPGRLVFSNYVPRTGVWYKFTVVIDVDTYLYAITVHDPYDLLVAQTGPHTLGELGITKLDRFNIKTGGFWPCEGYVDDVVIRTINH